MASETQYRLPVVSVIHYDVGHDRSISVEEFLRSLRRVPCDLSQRRTRKRKLCSRTLESQALTPANTRSTPFLACQDDAAIRVPDLADEANHSGEENPTILTQTQVAADPSRHALLQPSRASYRSQSLSGMTISQRSLISHAKRAARGISSPTLATGCTCLLPTSGSLSPEQSINFEPRQIKNIITYASLKEKPSQNLTEKKSPKKQWNTRRRCVSPSELLLVDSIEANTELNYTTNQRTPAQQQLTELKHKIRLSKNSDINPTEFNFPPPMTPPATRRTTWKLGSGFQRRRFLRPLTGRRNPPNQEATINQIDLHTTAPRIQTANHTSSTPGIIEAEEIPLLDDKARQSKKPQTMISKHISGE